MKKYSWLFLAAGLLLAACEPLGFSSVENDFNQDGIPDGTYTITLNDGSVKVVCNSTTWQLNAGNTFKNAGFVNVSNDNEYLYITVNATYGFQAAAENIKVWVGTSLDLLPVNGQGVPIQGQFPFKTTVTSDVNEYTFIIPWADIEAYNGPVSCSSRLYVYTHADVISDAEGGTDTAWGGDTCTESQDGAVKRWVCSGIYQAKCCDTTPPPPGGTTQTAFAKGGYVFTSDKKSNPEKLPSLNITRNRWGWAINLMNPGTTTYNIWAGAGLNYTSKGTLVGTLTVVWDGSSAIVSYQMNNGYSLHGIHVYAEDAQPVTIAPGQYGNTVSFEPGTTTSFSETYAVADTNGDGIWIIAHAGVYGSF